VEDIIRLFEMDRTCIFETEYPKSMAMMAISIQCVRKVGMPSQALTGPDTDGETAYNRSYSEVTII